MSAQPPKKKLSSTIRITQVSVSRTSKVGNGSHFVALTANYDDSSDESPDESTNPPGDGVAPPPRTSGWTLREARLIVLQVGHSVMQSSMDLAVADGDVPEDEVSSHRTTVKGNYKRYITDLLGSS